LTKKGPAHKYGEPTKTVAVRIPESWYVQIPEQERTEWIVDAIRCKLDINHAIDRDLERTTGRRVK
jgi:hypothetical protein